MKASDWMNSLRGLTVASRIFGRSCSSMLSSVACSTGWSSAGTPLGRASKTALPLTARLRSRLTRVSNCAQLGIRLVPAAAQSRAVRTTASLSVSAACSSRRATPSLWAHQTAASIRVSMSLRLASSSWISGSGLSAHLASTGISSSRNSPLSCMLKWVLSGRVSRALSMSEPALERDRMEWSRSSVAAVCRSPSLTCSRCRLIRLTMRSRAFSSSGRRNSVPK